MSGKKSRLMRKLLGISLKKDKEEFYSRHTIEQDALAQKLIIDGTEDESGGGSRIEYMQNLQVISNEERMQYRALKKLYKNSDHELHLSLKEDVDKLERQLKANRNKPENKG